MSKKREKIDNEYQQLQTKLFVKTALMMAAAFLITFGIYSIFLEGRFANMVVWFLEHFLFHDYEEALYVYQIIFRNNMDGFIFLAILIIFLIILRIYLESFTKYFNEINRGIQSITEENTKDVKLSPELSATEKKINEIRHTLVRRKMETENAEKRKNDLVVYLAHDLKTPLTSVIGYLTLLKDEKEISEELREKYLSISLEKAEHLEDLINEFFDITKFNLSNISLDYSVVNLTRFLEQLIFEFQPMFLEKDLTCQLEAEPKIMLCCDAKKMQRVFDNLLRNAVNYSFPHGKIRIIVVNRQTEISIRFVNRGTTISEEKLERIFEQFYRLDASRSGKSGGAGLGLAIAKEIVERHQGTILARSAHEEIEFEVTLPQNVEKS